jgi:hypothetical protein
MIATELPLQPHNTGVKARTMSLSSTSQLMARSLRSSRDYKDTPMQPATSSRASIPPVSLTTVDWDACLRRIRAEFWEMPGLALSVPQAQRLWSLDQAVVERLFAQLVASGELRQLTDRRFVRARNDR